MNKIKVIITSILFILCTNIVNFCTAQISLGNITQIHNTGLENAIASVTDPDDQGSILHIGSHRIFGIGNIDGLAGTSDMIDNYEDALTKVLQVIQNIVNYTLGILGLVALIYLIIHGIMILIAAGDDSKVKKGFKGIKNAFIAIAGIGLSWLIVSGILRLINTVAA